MSTSINGNRNYTKFDKEINILEIDSTADLVFGLLVNRLRLKHYIDLYCQIKKVPITEIYNILGINGEGGKAFLDHWRKHSVSALFRLHNLPSLKALPKKGITKPENIFKIIQEVNSSFGDLKSSASYNTFNIPDPNLSLVKNLKVQVFYEKFNLNFLQLFPVAVDENKNLLVDNKELATSQNLGILIFYAELPQEMIERLKLAWKEGRRDINGRDVWKPYSYYQKSFILPTEESPYRVNQNASSRNYEQKEDSLNSDYHGFDKDAIDSAFEGDESNIWNVD